MKKLIQYALVLFFLVPVFSCRRDKIITDSSAKLDLYPDSILFDTVFTTIGSATKSFTIYNRNNSSIKISSIRFGAGTNTQFRINVDGVPVKSATDVVIPAKDSLFVFVQVNVNPTSSSSPLIIRDSVIFVTNGNEQRVYLEAWGQDANYIRPNVFLNTGASYSIITCNDVWTSTKPYVIYGYAFVDAGCKLTMLAGTRVYMHKNAVLAVLKDGTLDVKGVQGNPVTVQGDRLEAAYKNLAGQWGQIWFTALSVNNKIDWAVIKNGAIGIHADTVQPASGNPTLQISNTIVKHMSAAGLYAQGAQIYGYNCVFADCGQYCALLNIGGKYSFKQCTFANYWIDSKTQRTTSAVLINNWYQASTGAVQSRNIDSAFFANCIIYGDLGNELALDSSAGGTFNYRFENCILKVDGNYKTSNTFHNNAFILKSNPQFKDVTNNDYNISSTSPARDYGDPAYLLWYPNDLNGTTRDALPDVGAYEFK